MTRNEYYNNLREANELYHHGIKGQKWGKKNGPPYPLKMNLQWFAKRAADLPELKEGYPGEFQHVISEINHWCTKEQKSKPVITKAVNNHIYTMDTKTGRIIGKKAIPDAITPLYERIPYKNDEQKD